MIFDKLWFQTMYNTLIMLEKKPQGYSSLYKTTGVSHDTLQKCIKFLLGKNLIRKEDKGHKKSKYLVTEDGKKYSRLLGKLKEF